MTSNVSAEIVTIGTEILLGEITDTNSVFIARVLRDIGVNLYFMTSVGDNEGRIADAIRIALSRADVVITCGGLGPTVDDVTRQAVAAATDRGLTFHQHLLDGIAARFAAFRAQMTENNRRQAFVPDGASVIENPVGTAPAFVVEHEGKHVVSLPGVPREMKFLMSEGVVPFLRERYGLTGQIIKARVLRTAGVGESALDEMIGNNLLEGSNPTVGLAAHSGQVDVRITAKAESAEQANDMIAEIEKRLRDRIGAYIFGTDDATIEGAFLDALRKVNGRVAVIEAGLPGAISDKITSAAQGSELVALSRSFAGPEALRESLGVGPEVPPRQLAERAAKTAQADTGADLAIAVVSYPDVPEDHADTDEASAVAVSARGEVRSRGYGFGAESENARPFMTRWALATAWRMLTE